MLNMLLKIEPFIDDVYDDVYVRTYINMLN